MENKRRIFGFFEIKQGRSTYFACVPSAVLSLFNSFNKFATHHIPPCLKRQSESRCVEEVGHWLPRCSGLLTPVGSDEPFQAKNLSPCDFFFSQKMASSNNNISLATLLEWYKIRDTFFGVNYVSQNIPLALEMAAACQHPEARWLHEACAGKDVQTREHAIVVFESLGDDDVRALCFSWKLQEEDELWPHADARTLRKSANLGYSFAQACVADCVDGGLFPDESECREAVKFAEMAAAQGERDGLLKLGSCLRLGEGCEKNLERAKHNLSLAVDLGSVYAMAQLGMCFESADVRCWRWLGCAAAKGCHFNMVQQVFELRKKCRFTSLRSNVSAAVTFLIGQAFKGHVSVEEKHFFGKASPFFEPVIAFVEEAIREYDMQVRACRQAVDSWTLVGKHFGVVKDVRKLIAKLIWDSREEALFKFAEERNVMDE
jgi:hypothetical protein